MPSDGTSQANASASAMNRRLLRVRIFPNSNSEFRRAADCGLPPVPQFARLLAGVRRRQFRSFDESVGSPCFFLIYQLILKFIR
jgi:hypothetical protein